MKQLAETAISVVGKGRVEWVRPETPAVHRALDAGRLRLLPYTFKHVLTHEVAYEALLQPRPRWRRWKGDDHGEDSVTSL